MKPILKMNLHLTCIILFNIVLYVSSLDANKPLKCLRGTHRCGDNSRCVEDKDLCDFNPDCNDFSDENYPMCKRILKMKSKCQNGKVFDDRLGCQRISAHCKSNETVGFSKLCNEIKDGLKAFSSLHQDENLTFIENVGMNIGLFIVEYAFGVIRDSAASENMKEEEGFMKILGLGAARIGATNTMEMITVGISDNSNYFSKSITERYEIQVESIVKGLLKLWESEQWFTVFAVLAPILMMVVFPLVAIPL